MIKSTNMVILHGNVVEAPKLRKAGESDVTTVRLAVNNSDKEKDTLFINVECWRNNAVFASKFFNKGSFIGVVGTLKTREYENKEGAKVRETFVEAETVNFAGPKRDAPDAGGAETSSPSDEKPKQATKQKTPEVAKKPPVKSDDDLPF